MLYHASQTSGLKELTPHISTHGKPYVYAIAGRLTAMLFGAPKDDFDFIMDEKDGKPVIYECYPDAFKTVYLGRSCSLYEVDEDGFLRGKTSWAPECVCEHAVPVVKETVVDDLFDELTRAVRNGELVINAYRDDAEYKSLIREQISARVALWGLTEEQLRSDKRFARYHNKLLANG